MHDKAAVWSLFFLSMLALQKVELHNCAAILFLLRCCVAGCSTRCWIDHQRPCGCVLGANIVVLGRVIVILVPRLFVFGSFDVENSSLVFYFRVSILSMLRSNSSTQHKLCFKEGSGVNRSSYQGLLNLRLQEFVLIVLCFKADWSDVLQC